jgi:hypothetical protein
LAAQRAARGQEIGQRLQQERAKAGQMRAKQLVLEGRAESDDQEGKWWESGERRGEWDVWESEEKKKKKKKKEKKRDGGGAVCDQHERTSDGFVFFPIATTAATAAAPSHHHTFLQPLMN